jgi:hypothetical protein
MWSDREKSTYLITALKGRAADVLAGIPINTPYEDTLQILEHRFGDQHFAAAYRCQLSARKQKAGESLQKFATAIELLAHRAYPTLPEDHIGREAANAFTHGVDDHDIKIQLLLGGEKTIIEAPRKAIELQAVLVAVRPPNSNSTPYGGNRSTPHGNGTRNNPDAGTVENRATSKLIAATKGITIINGNRDREIYRNHNDGQNGDKETTKKETGEVPNRQESSGSGLTKGECSRIH